MKKIIVTLSHCHIVSLLTCCLILPLAIHAQEATPTAEIETTETEKVPPTPSPKQSQLEKIQKLKERVATKVAELRKKSKRAYFGNIEEIAEKSFILMTNKGEVTIVIGEETEIFQISAGGKKAITFNNLKEGDAITALGLADKEGELTPRVIISREKPMMINGKVTAVDVDSGTITIATKKGGEFIVDYEKTTQCRIYEKGKGLVKGGLSQIEVDGRVHVIGTKGEEENRITAQRILFLPGKALGIVGKEEVTPTTSPSPTEKE